MNDSHSPVMLLYLLKLLSLSLCILCSASIAPQNIPNFLIFFPFKDTKVQKHSKVFLNALPSLSKILI